MAIAVEFDFEGRAEQIIPLAAVPSACAGGRFCWVDLDLRKEQAVLPELAAQVGLGRLVLDTVLQAPVSGRHDFHPGCIHITVAETGLQNQRLVRTDVDLVIGESFLLTVRRGDTEFIPAMHETYRQDFQEFARSPGFLLFEFWDLLLSSYRRTLRDLEAQVEAIQGELLAESLDEGVFVRVQHVLTDLLAARKCLVASREALHELAIRRSNMVPETTRPYLENLVVILERLTADLTVERETLAEAVGLYLGMVGHRTNRIVNRLTVISTVFLPLTFLCGVYGMNFDVMPELKWRAGYPAFWLVVLILALVLVGFMKRSRWW